MAVLIEPPLEIYTDLNGDPLEAGYIYIGEENLEPETNPINVFFDEALQYPALQPIRTIAGAPSRNGTQAVLYIADGDVRYSTKVEDKNGNLITSALSSTTAAVTSVAAANSAAAAETAAVAAQVAAEAAQAAAEAAAAAEILLQTVHTPFTTLVSGGTALPFDNSIPQNTEGFEFMVSDPITANFATSILEITVVFFGSCRATITVPSGITIALFKDSIVAGLKAVAAPAIQDVPYTTTFIHHIVAGSTLAQTFKVRAGDPTSGLTVTMNGIFPGAQLYGGVAGSSITIKELKVP